MDDQLETNQIVMQMLGDFLNQTSLLNNSKARYELTEILNGAMMKTKESVA